MNNISHTTIDNKIIINLKGRIDTNNSETVNDEIFNILKDSIENHIVEIDAKDLEYISSAGLRVILKLRKQEPSLKIVNASSEIYDIFEMTGFSEMIPISKALRTLSVDGCTIIGRGAKGIIYRYDEETIVKVYINPESLPEIQNERNLARKAFVLGIPTAISYDVVKVGDSYGSVFELLDASSYTELIKSDPENFNQYVKEYANLLRLIHTTRADTSDMTDIKPLIYTWLETDKPYLKDETYQKIKNMIKEVPDTSNLLHCDYHTNNVLKQNDETLLIDMGTISYGHPIFELANIYLTYVGFGEVDPTFVENFIGLPYDMSKKIWTTFLPIYLKTENPERILDVENKTKLLSYIRYLRHFVRRNPDAPETKEIINCCVNNIENLVNKIDSFVF